MAATGGPVRCLAAALLAASIPTCDAFIGSTTVRRSTSDAATTCSTMLASQPVGPLRAETAAGMSMHQLLSTHPPDLAFRTIFGPDGERGEYMDGYSPEAMAARCAQDYKWDRDAKTMTFSDSKDFASERANMMAHLYDNEELWEHVCMVAFAEHYVLTAANTDGDGEQETEETALKKPFETFQRQKVSQSESSRSQGDSHGPILSGVVLGDWQSYDTSSIEQKLAAFRERGIDYVRLECNFGSPEEIGGAAQLKLGDDDDNNADHPRFQGKFRRMAEAAKACQAQEMVPLVLLQVPWREGGDSSNDYFEQVVQSLAGAFKKEGVESNRLLLETRPPIGVTAQEERSLSGTERIVLGLETGRTMFKVIDDAFEGDTIAGFCVAGGSTKGDIPTAMEDDTQNAVRQGMRQCARRRWGYEVCFWEMGAKLMLQPKVGRLWGGAQGRRDAARELFCVNAEDLADEIKASITDQ